MRVLSVLVNEESKPTIVSAGFQTVSEELGRGRLAGTLLLPGVGCVVCV